MMIRKYISSDCEQIARLFYETVHSVNAKDYTPEQLDVWATGNVDIREWDRSFCEHYTVVCAEGELILGFGDIDKTGYLDRLYVHKDYQRRRIASALCDELEKAVNVPVITTHASITAKGFFEKRGYNAVREQQVIRSGIALTNFIMVKKI
ncbi:GNAT family N-acetyltransferase [Huintestinicola sp.]|uniref:GNAT family N-acetyltransferase n=1 Tax=Huintestinicola sp. TaxID=2981661 RepID=UPI003D7D156A